MSSLKSAQLLKKKHPHKKRKLAVLRVDFYVSFFLFKCRTSVSGHYSYQWQCLGLGNLILLVLLEQLNTSISEHCGLEEGF
jgi:hypothetical protein